VKDTEKTPRPWKIGDVLRWGSGPPSCVYYYYIVCSVKFFPAGTERPPVLDDSWILDLMDERGSIVITGYIDSSYFESGAWKVIYSS
jgi:hypothetical protein